MYGGREKRIEALGKRSGAFPRKTRACDSRVARPRKSDWASQPLPGTHSTASRHGLTSLPTQSSDRPSHTSGSRILAARLSLDLDTIL